MGEDRGKPIGGTAIALLSALAYGVSVPFIKLLEDDVPSTTASALLYLGCGLCMVLVRSVDKARGARPDRGAGLSRHDAGLLTVMVLLNAASVIALLIGISLSDAATASLLGDFEVVATVLFARAIFHERMGARMWVAVAAITVASMLLSWDPGATMALAPGAVLVLLACVLWGLENSTTRALSSKDVVSVTMVKGFGTALACAVIAIVVGDAGFDLVNGLLVMLIGFVSYGLSIMLYIFAQRILGAARTGNYFSVAPFVGVGVSWAIFGIAPSYLFVPALVLSLAGVALTAADVHAFSRRDLRSSVKTRLRADSYDTPTSSR